MLYYIHRNNASIWDIEVIIYIKMPAYGTEVIIFIEIMHVSMWCT